MFTTNTIKVFLYCFTLFFYTPASASAVVSPDALQKPEETPKMQFVPQIWEKRVIGLLEYNPSGTVLAESVRVDQTFEDRFGPNIMLFSSKGYLLRSLDGVEDSIREIRFSSDGEMLVASDERGFITIWLISTGKILSSWQADESHSQLVSLSFSNESKMLVTLARGGAVKFWDLGGRVIKTFNIHGLDYTNQLWFANKEKNLVYGNEDTKTIRVWDLNGRFVREFPVPGLNKIMKSNDDGIVCFTIRYANGAIGQISVWDIKGNKISGGDIKGRLPSSAALDNNKSVTGDGDYTRFYRPVAVSEDGKYFADEDATVWAQNGQLLSFSGRFTGVHSNERSGDIAVNINGEVVFRTMGGELELWNVIDKTLSRKIKSNFNSSIVAGMIGNKFIVTPSLRLFDLSGRFIQRVSTSTEVFAPVIASPDGKKVAAYTGHATGTSTSNSIYLWDSNWKLLKKFENLATRLSYDEILPFAFSPDSKLLAITVGEPYKVKIWDLDKGSFVADPGIEGAGIRDLYFTPEGRLAVNRGGGITIFDLKTRTMLKAGSEDDVSAMYNGNGISPRAYSPETNLLATSHAGVVRVIDHATGEVVKESALHSRKVTGLKFSNDGKFLISSGADNTIVIWNTRTWEHIRLISDMDDEWLIYSPDGYFDASPHGGKLVAMVKGLDAYNIDQFAARYNRPDLILERMQLADAEAISLYQRLYYKRLKKLGLSEAHLSGEPHVPEAKITGVAKDGKFLTVTFQLSDTKYPLKRYNIHVNDIPLFESNGFEISGSSFSGSKSIELTAGKNKVEISAINTAGAESYGVITYAEYAKKVKGDLYYLAFGLSKYKDSALNLNYADKDAKDLEEVVLKMSPAYKNIYTKIYVNSDATAENIKKAKDFLKSAKIDDTVILLVAGHGGYDKTKEPKYYYLPYEAALTDLAGTGVDFETIEDILVGIKPRRKLFLIDTCESGELEEETYEQYYALADSRGIKPRTFRKPMKSRGQAAGETRGYLYQKDRFIYNDLARRSGAIVFSSSRGGELSYESSNIQNGFFTKEVINAFTNKAADKNGDGYISTDELKAFVSTAVAKDTENLQHPTVDRDNHYQQIEFPSVTRKRD